MTDSLERFLHDLHFEVPTGLVDRAKAAAIGAPRLPRDAREHETSLSRDAGPTELGPAVLSRPTGLGRRTEWAVGIAAILIAAIVIGTFVYIRTVAGLHNMAPAVPDPSIKQYQAMIAADQPRTLNFLEMQCTVNPPESTACADAAAVAIRGMQPWLDHLNQSRPPARFAAIDGRMRHHLVLVIADLRAVIAANRATDVSGAATAVSSAQGERDTLNRESFAVILSDKMTVDSYSGVVRLDNSNLLACDLCRKLASPSQLSCQAAQTQSCSDEIAAMRLQVETFQDDLVRNLAPASLAAKDAKLQADLLVADVALDAMDAALSAGDQSQLASSQNTLRGALGRAAADASNITS